MYCYNTIIKNAELRDTWKEHIEQLFYDTRSEPPKVSDDTGSDILVNEVEVAIKTTKVRKSPGLDNTHTEYLKPLDDDSTRWLTSKIYKSGEIPLEWLRSEFITLPKKSEPK